MLHNAHHSSANGPGVTARRAAHNANMFSNPNVTHFEVITRCYYVEITATMATRRALCSRRYDRRSIALLPIGSDYTMRRCLHQFIAKLFIVPVPFEISKKKKKVLLTVMWLKSCLC